MAYPILAPSNTWYKSSALRSTITEINIVDSYTPTGSETETWNADVDNSGSIKCYRNGTVITIAGNGSGKIAMNADSSYLFSSSDSTNIFENTSVISGLALLDASSATTFNRLFNVCRSVIELDVGDWATNNVTELNFAFSNCNKLSALDISNWDVSNVTTMENMFQADYALQSLDLSNWDVGNVVSMRRMFIGPNDIDMQLTTIGNVSNWNVSNVTTMESMFSYCAFLSSLDLSNWKVGNVTNMSFMFNKCTSLTTLDVSSWDTSNVTNMEQMFGNCRSLTSLAVSNWDVSNVVNMGNMFTSGSLGQNTSNIKLDVSNWDTSSCTDMRFMFYGFRGCNLDLSRWDVSKVTTFDHMFAHSHITIGDVSNWTTPAATNMNGMFHTVKNTTLNVSNLITKNVTCFDQMFEYCDNLTRIIGLENFDTSSSYGFSEMFQNCSMLKELDLSSFDTTKAKNGAVASSNGSTTTCMSNMFKNMYRLEKITLGPNFSFNGDGTGSSTTLPIPSAEYIADADGNWYTDEGESFTASAVPSYIARTYYARESDTNRVYMIDHATMYKIAKATRMLNNTTDRYVVIDIPSAIASKVDFNANGKVISLNDCKNMPLNELIIHGKTYQDGTPSTDAPVELVGVGANGNIVQHITGRNLFNVNGELVSKLVGATGAITNNSSFLLSEYFPVTPETTYRVRWESSSTYMQCRIAFYDKDLNFISRAGNDTHALTKTIESPKNAAYGRFNYSVQIYSNGVANAVTRENIVISIENVKAPTTYVEYTPIQSLTIPVTNELHGIAVDSGGNYIDSAGQSWVCDEINLSTGVLRQKIGVIESYNGEVISGAYMSTTGGLDVGAKVIYAMDYIIETPLDSAIIEAYKSLNMNEEWTNIFNSDGAEQSVKYLPNIIF